MAESLLSRPRIKTDEEIKKLIKEERIARQKKSTTLTKVRSGVEISVDEEPNKITKLEQLYKPFPETEVNFGKGQNAILSNFSDVGPSSPGGKRKGLSFGKSFIKGKQGTTLSGKIETNVGRFRTAEGAYQAFKSGTYVPGFENLTGPEAKRKGRKIKVNKDISERLMRDIVAERYKQDFAFRDALLQTGKITHSVGDKHWAEMFPRILEDVRDYDMKKTSSGKLERVARTVKETGRYPLKGDILTDINKKFKQAVGKTVEAYDEVARLPVELASKKRTANLEGGQPGFVSKSRTKHPKTGETLIKPDVRVHGWLTDMLDETKKAQGGDLKYFGHSLPAEVWSDVIRTTLSGTMEHLSMGSGKGPYKFAVTDPDVRTWIEANRGVEEAILKGRNEVIARPTDQEGEVLVKKQIKGLSADKTKSNMTPVTPQQARNPSGSYNVDKMDTDVKTDIKTQSYSGAVYGDEVLTDLKQSTPHGVEIIKPSIDQKDSHPVLEHIEALKKETPLVAGHTIEERHIPTIFTGGSREQKSEIIQSARTVKENLSPLDEAKESIRVTGPDFNLKVGEHKRKLNLPPEDKHEVGQLKKKVSEFEEDPIVKQDLKVTSKQRLEVAKKQGTLLTRNQLTPASLPASTTTVAQTDSVIPASNPANVPILKESKKVNKPVAVSYDGRHGGVYEGDKIEQGVEMSPLGRKEDLNINIGVSSGDYPFVVSDVKEPTPTTLKKGETIISSGTRIKPGKKQPASVTATTTEVKSWMKSKAVQRAIKAGTVLSSFPFIGELFTPLEVAQAHDTVIKPRQEKYGGSGLASGRDRDYGKVMQAGKRKVTPLTEFKNWKEWDAVKGFSAWAKNRSLTARSLRR
tara:strand:+ start:1159 stop:3738 length:2580 start_codon:yes stop_codon:yes gene_type:complete